jgi:hypothetical protein
MTTDKRFECANFVLVAWIVKAVANSDVVEDSGFWLQIIDFRRPGPVVHPHLVARILHFGEREAISRFYEAA